MSPPYSFVTIPPRPVSLGAALRSIWRWWRPLKPTQREQQLQDAIVAKLAAELEAETSREARFCRVDETHLDETDHRATRPRRPASR